MNTSYCDNAFAEVVESSLHHFVGQAWEWDNPPRFGSLLICPQQECTIFALVYDIKTGSPDPIRQTIAYQKTEEELQRDFPQIFTLLQTTFSCITLGTRYSTKTFFQAPFQPAKIHSFLKHATLTEYADFFESALFMHRLFGLSELVGMVDELLLALFFELDKNDMLSPVFMEQSISTFSLLTGNDYRRLKLFLQRMENFIKE